MARQGSYFARQGCIRTLIRCTGVEYGDFLMKMGYMLYLLHIADWLAGPGAARIPGNLPVEGNPGGPGPLRQHPQTADCRLQTYILRLQTADCRDTETQDAGYASQPGGPQGAGGYNIAAAGAVDREFVYISDD